jgi:hypothetical protein
MQVDECQNIGNLTHSCWQKIARWELNLWPMSQIFVVNFGLETEIGGILFYYSIAYL